MISAREWGGAVAIEAPGKKMLLSGCNIQAAARKLDLPTGAAHSPNLMASD